MLLCLPSTTKAAVAMSWSVPSFQQIHSLKHPNSQKAATWSAYNAALVPSLAPGCWLAGQLGPWQHGTPPWTRAGKAPFCHHRVGENIGPTFKQTPAKPSTTKLPKRYTYFSSCVSFYFTVLEKR